jgi:hypothetical protein
VGESWAGDAMSDTAKARLAACPQIMINPSATLAGTAKGRLAADKAINVLYLSRRANTKPALPKPRTRTVREAASVAAIDKTTAILAGHSCAPSQYTAPPSAPISAPATGT